MIARLGRREKILVGAVLALVVGLLIQTLVVDPLLTHRKDLEREIKDYRIVNFDLEDAGREYLDLKKEQAVAQARYERRSANFRLFTFLDSLAKEADVEKYRKYIRPSSSPIPDSPYKKSVVEMKLAGLPLEPLMNYLYRIETSPNEVDIARISITEAGKDSHLVDALIQVVTLEKS